MPKRLFFGWLLGVGLLTCGYGAWGRELVVQTWEGTAPLWWTHVLHWLYPRFEVEKHRFELSFFLQKADQVVIRMVLVNGVVCGGLLLYTRFPVFTRFCRAFWNQQVTVKQVKIVSGLYFAGMLFFSYEWYALLTDLYQAAAFYKPVPLLSVFHLGFPTPLASAVGCALLLQACCLTMLQIKPVFFSSVAAALFILLQAWLYSFEKMDHTFATFTYAAMLMPFLLYEQRKAIQKQVDVQEGWPLQLICLCVGLVYFMAGLEKVLISGTNWWSPQTFRNYIYLHQAWLGMQVAGSTFLCTLLPLLALVFQIGFIGAVFFKKWRIVLLLGGVAFHAGTYLLLGVGGLFNAWIVVYIFFINWDKVFQSLFQSLRSML
jgi:uncharacterized membrane protein (DUF485 family)